MDENGFRLDCALSSVVFVSHTTSHPHTHIFSITHHNCQLIITIMVKSLTKVVYKPDSQSREEYSMIVDAEQVGWGSIWLHTLLYTEDVHWRVV